MTKKTTNNNNESNGGSSLSSNKDISSPGSLSFEMIDESVEDNPPMTVPPPAIPATNGYAFEKYAQQRESFLYSLPTENFTNLGTFMDGPNSTSENEDLYLDNYANDLDYYPMKSGPTLNNVVEPEREDFPVNNAQMPDYAPKMDIMSSATASNATSKSSNNKARTKTHAQRRQSPPNIKPFGQTRKLSNISSISTVELHRIDDSMTTAATTGPAKKHSGISRNGSPTRNYTSYHNNNHKVKRTDVKEVNHARNNRKITVQILASKAPTRSKTSFDLRSSSSAPPKPAGAAMPSASMGHHPMANSNGNSRFSESHGSHHGSTADENAEISLLTAYHERVYHELGNRYATMQIIRNTAR